MRKAKEILSILLHFAHEKPFPPFPASSSCQNNLLKICRVGTKKRGFPPHTQKEATDFDACYKVTHRIGTQLVEPFPTMVLTFSGTQCWGLYCAYGIMR